MSKIKKAMKEIDQFIGSLTKKYPDISDKIDEIIPDIEIFFMQNLKDYDIYTLRFAILDLSEKYFKENKETEKDILFHMSLISSYLKENLHPVEMFEDGVIYNDIYIQFLYSLANDIVDPTYPLATDYINDILSREGFLKDFLEEGDILTNGMLFYKSAEGKIVDFCFNKILFNKTPEVFKKFVKEVNEEEVKFNTRFAKELYNALYNTLEEKFGNSNRKKKKFSAKILNKDVIQLQKFIQKLVDEKELKYMLSVAQDNTQNIFLYTLPDIINQMEKNKTNALKLAIGLGTENTDFISAVMTEFSTDKFLEGLTDFIIGYQNAEKLSVPFIFVLNVFIKKFGFEIPLITDNPDTLKLYDRVVEEFDRLLDKIRSVKGKELETSGVELGFRSLKYIYHFRKFEFEEVEKLSESIVKDFKNNEFIQILNTVNKFLIGKFDKDKVAEELDKIYQDKISKNIEDNEDLELFTALNIGGYIKMLKYILTDKDEDTDIYNISKAYLNNDENKIKNIIKKNYLDEDIEIEKVMNLFDSILKLNIYKTLQLYPFDKRIYQLYNPNYSYKIPKFENGKLVWVEQD